MRDFLEKLYDWLHNDGALPWVVIVGAFWAFWPVGIAALLMKLDVIDPRKMFGDNAGYGTVNVKNASERKKEYKNISRNMNSVSIDYFASVIGVEFSVVMRDIQEMVMEGEFGPEAYIDYGLRRLMIRADASEGKASSADSQAEKTTAAQRTSTAKKTETTQKAGGKAKTTTKRKSNQKRGKNKKIQDYGNNTGAFLVFGIILCFIGIMGTADAVENLLNYMYAGVADFSDVWQVLSFLCVIAAGLIFFGVRGARKKRALRFASYVSIIGNRSAVSISELSHAVGVSESKVRKDIGIMLEKKFLGDGAYLDVGAGRLVLYHEEPKQQPSEQNEEPENRYSAIIMEIRRLNDEIADEMVSEKIDKIEKLTAKIFKVVEDKPEKLPEIKSFMSYYLPTTLKLLRAYSAFENQGVSGANIDTTKERIEKILDTLVSGFSQQLDQLFTSDAMDISSDIDVLETMMRRDGLSKDESGFHMGQTGV